MQGFLIEPVRVYLVAPPMVGWGLERLVQSAHPRMELLGCSPQLPAELPQSCNLLIAAVDSHDDFGELAHFLARVRINVLVVTGMHDTETLDKAILAGARGVVKTSEPPQVLLKAIEKVNDGELWIDRGATSRIFMEMARQKAAQGDDPEKTKIATLTMRERQTIAAVAGDASAPAKVIARRLCISEHTLRNHLTSIYSKLELSSRLDLYAYATRHHLVDAPMSRR